MPPLLKNKNPSSPSVFRPAALLREARRQKGLAAVDVPSICILDPDGDIVRRLRHAGQAKPFDAWPCYHTALDTFTLAGQTVGIVGCAVGAPFAVLVAEELFASGCRLLISLTSAGQITPAGPPPYFVIIERALRDEGTSYHYAAPSEYAEAEPALVAMAAKALGTTGLNVVTGSSWTTDAPFRETAEAIEAARAKGSSCGRDGSRRALCVRAQRRTANSLPCPCHEYHGTGRAGFRKRRSGRNRRRAADSGSNCAVPVTGVNNITIHRPGRLSRSRLDPAEHAC